jgi:hypothetical protein
MTYGEAIAKADDQRPSEMQEAEKLALLDRLEADIREMMELEDSTAAGTSETVTLLDHPRDRVYVLWLCAMIDLYNHETDLLTLDMDLCQTELAEVRAWWRRCHRGPDTGNWRV